MTAIQAILFIVASFALIFSLLHIVAAFVNAICQAITKVGKPISVNTAGMIAALSFAYIMSYLFIW